MKKIYVRLILLASILFLLYAWVNRQDTEGFQAQDPPDRQIAVFGKLSDLSMHENRVYFASIPTGRYNPVYDVIRIRNRDGAVVWSEGEDPKKDFKNNYYILVFKSPIDYKQYVENASQIKRFYIMDVDTTQSALILGRLTDLTDPDQQKRISSLFTGSYASQYDITRIQSATGEQVWKKGDSKSGDTAGRYYIVTFASPINAKTLEERIRIMSQFKYSAPERKVSYELKIVGKSVPNTQEIVIAAPLANISKSLLFTIESSVTGSPNPDFKVKTVTDTAGQLVWSEENPRTYPSEKTENKKQVPIPENLEMKYFKLKFSKPIDLDTFKLYFPEKVRGATYVGTGFPATPPPKELPPASRTGYEIARPFPVANKTGDESELKAISTRPVTPETPKPEYEDPRKSVNKNDLALPTDLAERNALAAPVVVTNRIRVEAEFNTLKSKEILDSLAKAAGKGKVIEILDEQDRPIWPKGTYTGEGKQLFTVGFSQMIDVNNQVRPYIERSIPSIRYKNPAIPRPVKARGVSIPGPNKEFLNQFQTLQGFQNMMDNSGKMLEQGLEMRKVKA